MAGLCLYSATPWVKLLIQERYRQNVHFVWCSEHADTRLTHPNSLPYNTPPTSNPAEIYAGLRTYVQRGGERHNDKVNSIRQGCEARAVEWREAGVITTEQQDEIFALVNNPDCRIWRPVLLVIPRAPINAARVQLVPPAKRAGFAEEWTISDLRRDEFDEVELP